jgi:hypothetical protein
MGNGDATTNLPLHMGWILVETAAEPETEASPFFTLYTHSTPAEVRRSTRVQGSEVGVEGVGGGKEA